jgi:transcriptional accessory protein Tex/SPT6
MRTKLEVQSAIEQLSKAEIRDLSKWLQEYLDEEWDRQIEADFGLGKLDRLIAKAESDIANNNVRNLDEVLDNL